MIAGLQVLHIEFEEIKGSWTCTTEGIRKHVLCTKRMQNYTAKTKTSPLLEKKEIGMLNVLLNTCVHVQMCHALHITATCCRSLSSCGRWIHVCRRLLSYPAGPACWRSGCRSSGSGTSPSRQTWSAAGRGRGARPEISEDTKKTLQHNSSAQRFKGFTNVTCEVSVFRDAHVEAHLEGLAVLALSSPLPEKSLLFLLLLLLLQSSDVLLKTYEGILFVHVCQQETTRVNRENWGPTERHLQPRLAPN